MVYIIPMFSRFLSRLRRLLRRPKTGYTAAFLPSPDALRLRTFVDQHVDLTGKRVERCIFDGCVVELRGHGRAAIVDNTFSCCDLVGDGWPEDVLAENRRANRKA